LLYAAAMRWLALLLLMTSSPDRLAPQPELVVWAWERPEDLRGTDVDGVAFLTGTVVLRGEDVERMPRRQPLQVPAGIPLTAVVRVETRRPVLGRSQADAVVEIARAAARLPAVGTVQIDFDAVESERGFYLGVLQRLRRELPATTRLSMTALASWCLGDPWIREAPVDEAVPMLFRMGPDDRAVRRHLAGGGDFSLSVCRGSVGIATDEPVPALPASRRTYVFHPRAWTARAVPEARARLRP
jgi:hypothetical protein